MRPNISKQIGKSAFGRSIARVEDGGKGYNRLRNWVWRWHQQAATAVGTYTFFNVARTPNVCNAEVANQLGDFNKLIQAVCITIWNAGAVLVQANALKVIQDSIIEFKIGGLTMIPETRAMYYFREFNAIGPIVAGDGASIIGNNFGYGPELAIPYEANENIQLTVQLNTASANALVIAVALGGPEYSRGVKG